MIVKPMRLLSPVPSLYLTGRCKHEEITDRLDESTPKYLHDATGKFNSDEKCAIRMTTST